MSKKRQRVQPRPTPSRPGERPAPYRRRDRPDWLVPVGISVGGLVVLAVVVVLLFGRASPSSSSTSFAGTGQTIDGVQCQTSEQVVYHIHAHLAIFANGAQRTVPMGIGIPTPQVENTTSGPFVGHRPGFYWLHPPATNRILHVGSP